MKKLFLAASLLLSVGAMAQQPAASEAKSSKKKGYEFTDLTVIPGTSVKNQSRSGTCWSYSGIGFLENEIIKSGGDKDIDLSEMWIVRHAYFNKAIKAVRLHGHLNFKVGGALHDVTEVIKTYGIVPQEVYQGLNYGTELPNFTEFDAVVQAYVAAVIETKTLTTAWQAGLKGIFDSYFGEVPEKFTYKGKEYTPKSYYESLPLDVDDYISITSYTHHPFYGEFVLEIPDNWMWMPSYNVPLDEMMAVMDSALESGYSIAWAADVSEQGFNRGKSIAIVPMEDRENLGGTDAERWGALTTAEKAKALYAFNGPIEEKTITQEMRQLAYDNYETTDDHGMVIEGTAKDQDGNPFFKIKNSWSTENTYEGYYYFSRPYVEYKTMSIFVNKNAVPKSIAKSLGLK